MIKYWIEDSKKFNYSSDKHTNLSINVYELDSIIYSTNMELFPNINYFTSLMSGWNDKKVKLLDKNTNEEIVFNITGQKSKLTDLQISKFDNYSKKINLTDNTELCDIMKKHNSDKSTSHNYTKYYTQIFEKYRKDNIKLFELGLGTNNTEIKSNMGENGTPGASLFGWLEFFHNADIFGADIDVDCLFNTDRIKTFYCDQNSPWIIKQMWDNKYLDFKFDIIIDDGLHTFDANITFFENSYHKLNHNGTYIIEDVSNDEIVNWLQKIEEYETTLPEFNFEIILSEYKNSRDNILIKITYK